MDISPFYQLWSSDGTSNGTKLIMTDYHLQNGSRGFQPFVMAVNNNKLYMKGWDSIHWYQLWESDGTTLGTVMTTHYTKPTFNPTLMISYQNKLIINNGDVWTSDGTVAGTHIIDSTLNTSGYSPLYPFEKYVEYKVPYIILPLIGILQIIRCVAIPMV